MQLSDHFKSEEFACHHCGLSVPSSELVAALERLRSIVGKPLRIVSGTRCTTHNRAVGGAKNSRHLPKWRGQRSEAADIPAGYATIAQAKQAGLTGIGYRGRDQAVVHVDTRPGRAVTFQDGW